MRHIALVLLLAAVPFCSAVAQDQQTGLIFLDEASYRSIPLASTPLMGDVPSKVDLSSSFPEPRSQGQQGSCVGWAVANLKAYQEETERHWSVNSHRFSASFIYNQIRQSQDCNGGSYYTDALNVLRRDGIASLADFPYDETTCSAQPDAATKQKARPFSVADWRRVNVQDETEIKTQIASGFPVLIGMVVDAKFVGLTGDAVYDGPGGTTLGGHAMVVTGYSDQRNAFRVLNSWGTDWADGGLGWISYAAFRSTVREGYVVQDIVVNPPPVPQPPTPQPPSPVATNPVISLGAPMIVHNLPVPAPNGFGTVPGMKITVPGTVTNAAGKTLGIIVRFNFMNGPPLFANPAEAVYRDANGLVAAGTAPISIGTDSENLAGIEISIPYFALNFPPTNGMNAHNLSLVASASIDNVQLAQSPIVPFGLRW